MNIIYYYIEQKYNIIRIYHNYNIIILVISE